MARKFQISNFAETLGNVSKSDTAGREQIEYIDIGLIDDDPNNFYQLSGLDELASNIALLGLQQPLRVRQNPEDSQRVIIVSGHRRRAAIQQLVEEGRTDLKEIPCIREQSADSAVLQELRLIYANSDTRVLTSAELGRQAARVEELLYLLKEEGMEFPGRMRDHVAEACRVSAPKLARLKVIRENLVPEYMTIWEQDKLPEMTAYALARMPAEFQQRLAGVIREPLSGHTAEDVLKKYQDGWRWEPNLTCPDGTACKRGDTFLRHDCEMGNAYGFCGGLTCCLNCEKATRDWSPCDRMCSKAKNRRKDANAEEKAKELAEKQKRGRSYQLKTQVYAQRLLPVIDAAGLSDDECIVWEYISCKVSEIRQWASGEFSDPERWFSAKLDPKECRNAVNLSKLLGCSADFLLGLTDDPLALYSPAPEAEQDSVDGDLYEVDYKEDDDDVSESDTIEEDDEVHDRWVRWEGRGLTPPMGGLILTYALTNDGPAYRAALWDGYQFVSPANGKVLNGLQYTKWLEIPLPSSGDAFQLAPPEGADGQLVFSGWMSGGILPAEPCDVVADFRCGDSDTGTVLRQACRFDGSGFVFRGTGTTLDAECVRWMALPPVEMSEGEP